MAGASSDNASDKTKQTCLQRYSSTLDSAMQAVFHRLGLWVGGRPGTVVLVCMLVALACGAGMARFKQENRTEKLWVPQNSLAQEHRMFVDENFGQAARVQQVIVRPRNGGSVLAPAVLIAVLELHERVLALNATYQGEALWFEQLCFRRGGKCSVTSVLDLWQYNRTLLEQVSSEQVLQRVNQPNPVSNNGFALNLRSVLGGMEQDGQGVITSARALSLTYLLKNEPVLRGGRLRDERAAAWEQLWLDVMLERHEVLLLNPFSARSFSDEFGGAIGSDLPLVTFGYFIIIGYTAIMLGRCNKVQSRALLALGGVLCIGLSIITCFGLASAMGIIYGPVHSVLPFLLLGIGVDDMFVIVNAYRLAPTFSHVTGVKERVRRRLAASLAHSGVSVTVTSVTDFCAFMIGSATALPALSSFCQYAAIGIVMCYLLQVTMFSALLALDSRRMERGRVDCCPCATGKACCVVAPLPSAGPAPTASPAEVDSLEEGDARPAPTQAGAAAQGPAAGAMDVEVARAARQQDARNYAGLSRFFRTTYGPFLTRPYVKVAVLLLSVALVVGSIVAASHLEEDFDETTFLPDNSYLRQFTLTRDRYFASDSVNSPVSVYLRTGAFTDASVRGSVDRLLQALDDSAWLVPGSVRSWYRDYLRWLPDSPYAGQLVDGHPPDDTRFVEWLQVYLAGAGARYASDVVLEQDGGAVLASRFGADMVAQASSSAQVDSMRGLRAEVAAADRDGVLAAFPYSPLFIQYEQYAVIARELFQNVGSSLAAVTVLALILIAHPGTALLVALAVALAVLQLLGLMLLWNVALDAVATVVLVLALGLAVDYSAHVGHAFMLQSGGRNDRVVGALGEVGGSVLNGAISTFLAVMLLSISQSHVFRTFFKLFFGICVFGVFNGMVLLPVLLSLVGPAPYSGAAGSPPAHAKAPVQPNDVELTNSVKKRPSGGGKGGEGTLRAAGKQAGGVEDAEVGEDEEASKHSGPA